jgi:hypothetical protein
VSDLMPMVSRIDEKTFWNLIFDVIYWQAHIFKFCDPVSAHVCNVLLQSTSNYFYPF